MTKIDPASGNVLAKLSVAGEPHAGSGGYFSGRAGATDDECEHASGSPCQQEQHFLTGGIEKLEIVEREQHGAVVRHGFDHAQYGFGDSQTNRVGGRVRGVGYARINGAESRTDARRLRQPEWIGAAGQRIAAERRDELRDGRVRNALADFLTRDHEHRPRPRLE